MPQCVKYPDKCRGMVQRDELDGKWYCFWHRHVIDHLRETGRHK